MVIPVGLARLPRPLCWFAALVLLSSLTACAQHSAPTGAADLAPAAGDLAIADQGGHGGTLDGGQDLAGTTPPGNRVCASATVGVACGSGSCEYGEWCQAATQTCHCGNDPSCGSRAVCIYSGTGTNPSNCGDSCSPIIELRPPPR
jgi:hypothetical protein